MKCRECVQGRRFSAESVYCVMYGMIIREDHECTRKGGQRRERDEGDGAEMRGGTEIHEDSSGAA